MEVLGRARRKAAASLGFPLMHVKITVLGGEVHETESTELAFRLAAADAFNKGLREAGIVLLEPIMQLEVTVPDENLGDIVSDLQQRRAIITRTQSRGRNTVIEAQAPLANLFGYSSAMRGLSQGRATCTMEPACTARRRQKCWTVSNKAMIRPTQASGLNDIMMAQHNDDTTCQRCLALTLASALSRQTPNRGSPYGSRLPHHRHGLRLLASERSARLLVGFRSFVGTPPVRSRNEG